MYRLSISILSILSVNIAYCIMQPSCLLNQIAKRDITGSYLSACWISSCNCGLSCSGDSTCQCASGYYWTGYSCGM